MIVHDLRFTIYDSRFTIYDLRFTIYDSRFTIYDSRFTIHDSLFVPCAVLDDHVDILQQVYVPQYIPSDRDDVSVFAFADRPHLI